MQGQGNPFEEIQRLAKSTLASRVKDILVDTSELLEKDDPDLSPVEDDTEFSPEEKLELIRELVEGVIDDILPIHPDSKRIQKLAEKELARHIKAELKETDESAESRVTDIRQWIGIYIVSH